jgi:hypothetical protein
MHKPHFYLAKTIWQRLFIYPGELGRTVIEPSDYMLQWWCMDTLSYPLHYSWVILRINKARYEHFSLFFFSLRRLIVPLTRQYPSVPPGIRMSFHYRYI